MTDDVALPPPPAWMTVVRGQPTADELAALTLVVAAITANRTGPASVPPSSTWVTRSRGRLRPLPSPGDQSWRRAYEP